MATGLHNIAAILRECLEHPATPEQIAESQRIMAENAAAEVARYNALIAKLGLRK